jgi:competence protein ComEC
MVYDTGDGYSGGFSQAEKTVLPYLYTRGVDVIDVLVVSHGDRDHSGGLALFSESNTDKSTFGFWW